jgi:Zn-dependent protease
VLTGGYFTLGRIRRVPVRVHIATPVGLFVFTGFSFNPVLWGGILLIILVHELGHAFLVRRYRLPVLSIDITGIGGVCRYAGGASDVQESVIAWGGVLAQGVLLGLCEAIGKIAGLHGETTIGQVAETLVAANFVLIALNLLPFPPLDGAKAWALFRWRNLRRLGRQGRRAALKARVASIERELARPGGTGKKAPDSKRSSERWRVN